MLAKDFAGISVTLGPMDVLVAPTATKIEQFLAAELGLPSSKLSHLRKEALSGVGAQQVKGRMKMRVALLENVVDMYKRVAEQHSVQMKLL